MDIHYHIWGYALTDGRQYWKANQVLQFVVGWGRNRGGLLVG